ncbi:hypothetical protein ABR737_00735 [Streptomyces sp. Edi2]|uniref:hypothetical protein n=1 Tax=Streptomyces sp. Edi2 TaxID=3162528 RepID=UPI0033060AF8
MAFLFEPFLALPEYRIHTSEMLTALQAKVDGPLFERVKNFPVGVETRYFVNDLPDVLEPGTMQTRNKRALPGTRALAKEALLGALEKARLLGRQIDYLLVSNTTIPHMPGIDVWLNNDEELGLRRDIRRLPFTQLGCVGGAHTIALAAEIADANPGKNIAVVIPEALNTIFHPRKDKLSSQLWPLVFGDSATAFVVSSPRDRTSRRTRGACMEVTDSWYHLVEDMMSTFELDPQGDKLDFLSERGAHQAVLAIQDPLTKWMTADDPDWRPETVIGHAGGPAVLKNLAKMLGFPEDRDHPDNLLKEAWKSLEECANLGGGSAVHGLLLKAQQPARPGSPTLGVAIGPGITAAAWRGVMLDPNDVPAVA